MTQEKVEASMKDFDPEVKHRGARVAVGIDLSGARDLTAMAFATETGTMSVKSVNAEGEEEVKELPTYDIWVDAWTPGDTLQARAEATKRPYDLWAGAGYLKAVPGERIRFDHVASHLQRATAIYRIIGVAYDNYAYSAFRQECHDIGLDLPEFSHPQGGKARARPSDEEEKRAKLEGKKPPDGLWMPGSVKLLEDAFIDGRITVRASPVVMAAIMGATMSPEDDNGNKWFVKKKSTAAIDPVVAMAMAIGLLERLSTPSAEREFKIFFV